MSRVGIFQQKNFYLYQFILVAVGVIVAVHCRRKLSTVSKRHTQHGFHTTKICYEMDKNFLRARHKSCFLRPDTGPCRSDIIQFYFDAMKAKCYRFFWGGCQGNGNKFETEDECMKYCHITSASTFERIPHFCSLSFDYGTCFGHYNRWAWDKFTKTCKVHLYSGCGGNQNNFETKAECMNTCLNPPNNTMGKFNKYTTCVPVKYGHMIKK